MDQSHFPQHLSKRPGGRPYRLRRCLLKGCEQLFYPRHPQTHYCSEACRQAAQRWRRWRASQRYRSTENGKQRRRQQAQRYRQRCHQRQAAVVAEAAAACEGQRAASGSDDFSLRPCDRPGCYVLFPIRHEHSCQRFCSVACRLALRRVLDREARWRARRRHWRRRRLSRRVQAPDTS